MLDSQLPAGTGDFRLALEAEIVHGQAFEINPDWMSL